MYGRVEGYLLNDLSEKDMDRKVECCRDLLKILDLLDPGVSRLRGNTFQMIFCKVSRPALPCVKIPIHIVVYLCHFAS